MPAESGWQTAILDTAIGIDSDRLYVASYGTTENYAFSGGLFASDLSGSGGHLAGPGANGVFSEDTTGLRTTGPT